jgi:hypothetical protein
VCVSLWFFIAESVDSPIASEYQKSNKQASQVDCALHQAFIVRFYCPQSSAELSERVARISAVYSHIKQTHSNSGEPFDTIERWLVEVTLQRPIGSYFLPICCICCMRPRKLDIFINQLISITHQQRQLRQ